jgi:two-component system, cell cycle response regulator PopA
VMADEARLRFSSLAKFGGALRPPTLTGGGKPKILVFGIPSPQMLQFNAALEPLSPPLTISMMGTLMG